MHLSFALSQKKLEIPQVFVIDDVESVVCVILFFVKLVAHKNAFIFRIIARKV